VNITSNNVGSCQLKCDYAFTYGDSNASITNNATYISLSYDQLPQPPVIYNADKYQVREVRIYSPSIHRYEGQQAPAEMLIMHSSGSRKLIVSIPLVESSSRTKSSRFLDQVADYMRNFTQSSGQTASMGNATWNLNDFVPEKRYFSYSGTAPFPPCNNGYEYVVFSTNDNAQASISSNALAAIRSGISNSGIQVQNNTLYYSTNTAKATLDSVSDDIYISCQPVGESDEQTVVVNGSQGEATFISDLKEYMQKDKLLKNPYFQSVVAALVMLGVYKLGKLVFDRKKKA
jgi:carbonic anhydrase